MTVRELIRKLQETKQLDKPVCIALTEGYQARVVEWKLIDEVHRSYHPSVGGEVIVVTTRRS